MTEYEYRRKILEDVVGVDPEEGASVELPDDAVGITLKAFSDDVWVRYLVPVITVATDGGVDVTAEDCVANARSLLSDFEDVDAEIQAGSIKHAIAELENARRRLPNAVLPPSQHGSTIVGDPSHPAETHSPDDDDDPDAPVPVTDGGVPEYGAGDRFEFAVMGFQFEIAEVRETEIELTDGDIVDRDEFETDLEENQIELVDEEGDA